MINNSKFLGVILIPAAFFTFMSANQGMEEDYNDWEIVPSHSGVSKDDLSVYSGNNAYDYNIEDDFELKVKAFGNTALNVLEGVGMTVLNIGLDIIENEANKSKNQFNSGVALGSHIVGTLYGQGVALQQAYEKEKELLKESK